ncbi:hypothetical protein BDV98DRAFT_581852 [Pterulicium gracile]|uniref:Uncharacterized protein n=1 Tax=Pterulicium gracile TaxID=1884261 RepID=A0A5C3QM38_9AGAR|nr:hypothetical protein BDV98DRAFT_581852 [Pterula gracilis]
MSNQGPRILVNTAQSTARPASRCYAGDLEYVAVSPKAPRVSNLVAPLLLDQDPGTRGICRRTKGPKQATQREKRASQSWLSGVVLPNIPTARGPMVSHRGMEEESWKNLSLAGPHNQLP